MQGRHLVLLPSQVTIQAQSTIFQSVANSHNARPQYEYDIPPLVQREFGDRDKVGARSSGNW